MVAGAIERHGLPAEIRDGECEAELIDVDPVAAVEVDVLDRPARPVLPTLVQRPQIRGVEQVDATVEVGAGVRASGRRSVVRQSSITTPAAAAMADTISAGGLGRSTILPAGRVGPAPRGRTSVTTVTSQSVRTIVPATPASTSERSWPILLQCGCPSANGAMVRLATP